ncbi:MAG: type II toxin-antitoxin system RelE/ParE family toxin [Gemmatimonadota bacterium]|nr:type II toxin-antitoxin system RelE/ParE family toxin [Gemmatimonadota bacterium]
MNWEVEFDPEFDPEFDDLPTTVQDELLAQANLLKAFGPSLGRPRVDTLNGSRHANMKELRFTADGGVWRAAFAFDPKRKAILLVAGAKSGISARRFYKRLIKKADERFDTHLDRLKKNRRPR